MVDNIAEKVDKCLVVKYCLHTIETAKLSIILSREVVVKQGFLSTILNSDAVGDQGGHSSKVVIKRGSTVFTATWVVCFKKPQKPRQPCHQVELGAKQTLDSCVSTTVALTSDWQGRQKSVYLWPVFSSWHRSPTCGHSSSYDGANTRKRAGIIKTAPVCVWSCDRVKD